MTVPPGMRECVVCVLEPQIDVVHLRLTNISLAPAVCYLELMRTCLTYSLIKPDKSGRMAEPAQKPSQKKERLQKK